jgi:hypothetical protein
MPRGTPSPGGRGRRGARPRHARSHRRQRRWGGGGNPRPDAVAVPVARRAVALADRGLARTHAAA